MNRTLYRAQKVDDPDHSEKWAVTYYGKVVKRYATRRDARIADVKTIDDAVEASSTGWARLPWSELGTEGEAKLAERSVTVRCLVRADGSLPETGDEPDVLAYCARAY